MVVPQLTYLVTLLLVCIPSVWHLFFSPTVSQTTPHTTLISFLFFFFFFFFVLKEP